MVSSPVRRASPPPFDLAEINVARLRAPLDDPQIEGFVSRLAEINALADGAPGFVWRLQTETGDATSIVAYDDPRVIVNMSVWESAEALRAYTYRSGHADLLRLRGEWFEAMAGPHLALWWTPAGHRPDVEEGKERLAHLARRGPSSAAFTFREAFGAPEIDAEAPGDAPPLYDGRVFATRSNSENGESGAGTLFHYRQLGSHVWATYDGGGVRLGRLAARCDPAGTLTMRYQHLSPSGEFRSGRCRSVPERLPDGRLRLCEEWQWDGGDAGRSVLEEVELAR
jgi:heme-degrading monooxygenase HmoA